ncbi:glycosyltransferase [Polluticaenibacter yanchengensis]|uniref:Glycosyltransferase n=1 Tax=Polluticaenibacter yanchengensis TaxID=3014562 RepID=A0ABT4UK63_9BACT|nr:glycosyltransferase [Chitinophagaceae bacterium LY-5]
MRILQIIDSLNAGGAEKMAVNYANIIAKKKGFSALSTTRVEGPLKAQINEDVHYFFTQKSGTFDFASLKRLKRFVKQHKIDVIHAHGTSALYAAMFKWIYPKIKVVWHDHHGNRAKHDKKKNLTLQFAARFFTGVVACNEELKEWGLKNLACKNIIYLPNFVSTDYVAPASGTQLMGVPGKRIVQLANLKDPKNHIAMLKAFNDSQAVAGGWTLHLIGRDFEDDYSNRLKDFIKEHQLENSVFIYGARFDTAYILRQADIGVLSSSFEGFPVTLLEYGMANLAVATSDVGYCGNVIKNGERGVTFHPGNHEEMVAKLDELFRNDSLRKAYAQALNKFVSDNYADEAVVNKYLNWLEETVLK